MSNNEQRAKDTKTPAKGSRLVGGFSQETLKASSGPEKYSWYSGEVDEAVVKSIVRLKKEQKL